MHDQPLLLWTLSRFAAVLPARYDLETTLTELTESVTAVLGAFGSAVSMAIVAEGIVAGDRQV